MRAWTKTVIGTLGDNLDSSGRKLSMVGSCSKAIKMLLKIIVWNYRDGEQISYCSGLETDFPGGRVAKNLPTNTGDPRDVLSMHGLERAPGVGNGNPLQYSCLENSMDRRAWRATVHEVAKSLTPRSDWAGTEMRGEEAGCGCEVVAQGSLGWWKSYVA